MRSLLSFLATTTVLLLAPLARGASPDTIDLKDGTHLSGTVIKQEPGKFVVIRLADGSEQTLGWDDVKRVSTGPRADDAAGAPGSVTTERSGGQSTGGAGLSIGARTETVYAVKAPPSYSINAAIDGFFSYGTTTQGDVKANIYGGGVNAGLVVLAGQTFPGKEGGSWSGVRINPAGNFFGAGIVVPNDGAGLISYGGTLMVAYQYMQFGEMSPADLKQGGWGVYAGYRVGYASFQVISGQTTSSSSINHGPTVGFVFPDYNAGTAKLKSGYLQLIVMPLPDFFFLQIGGGGSF